MSCKNNTYSRWGFDGCARKALVKTHRKKYNDATPCNTKDLLHLLMRWEKCRIGADGVHLGPGEK